MRPARPLIALLACLGCGATLAQPIFRCGDSYSQQPCEGGRQLLPSAPAPSAADRSQAAAMVARDARLAETLEKDRTRREAQAGNALTVLPAAAAAEPEAHKWPEKAGTRKLDVFTATAPGSRSPKTKDVAKKAEKESGTAAGKKKADGGTKATQPRAVQPVKTAAAAKS